MVAGLPCVRIPLENPKIDDENLDPDRVSRLIFIIL